MVLEQGNAEPKIHGEGIRICERTVAAVPRGFKQTLGVTLAHMDLLGLTLLSPVERAQRQRIPEGEACDLDRLFRDIGRAMDLLVDGRLRRLAKFTTL